MLLKENKIVEKICEIPVTLEDVSESIFAGVSTKNIMMHRLISPEEVSSDSYYLCEGLCKPVFSDLKLSIHMYQEHFPINLRFALHLTILCCLMSCPMGVKRKNTELFLLKT